MNIARAHRSMLPALAFSVRTCRVDGLWLTCLSKYTPSVGEELLCRKEPGNSHDLFAVILQVASWAMFSAALLAISALFF